MPKLYLLLLMCLVSTGFVFGQASSTSAGLAGLGAGAALGGPGGPGGATPSSGSNAPPEIQFLTFKGLTTIAKDIAVIVRNKFHEKSIKGPILIEDPTSANQIALYESFRGYYDHLTSLHGDLLNYLPLTVTAVPIAFSDKLTDQPITLRNSGTNPVCLTIPDHATGASGSYFSAKIDTANCQATSSSSGCTTALQPNASCSIDITFKGPDATESVQSPTASIDISYPLTVPTGSVVPPADKKITVQLSATVPAKPKPAPEEGAKIVPQPSGKKPTAEDQKAISDWKNYLTGSLSNLPQETRDRLRQIIASNGGGSSLSGSGQAAATGTGSTPSTGTTANPPAVPYGLQWMNGASTLAQGLKAGETYAPSSTQPTTQAFEILIEEELNKTTIKDKDGKDQSVTQIKAYTSTSTLNLAGAVDRLTPLFGQMLADGSDITTWSNQCGVKPAAVNGAQPGASGNGAQPTPQPSPVTYSACTDSSVTSDIAVAQQMMTGYTTLFTAASDGNGNPVIVDILRGNELSYLIGEQSIPSLQVAVAAAGGSSRTNNIFGANLFYQFAPSYNAGVIATFELRDGKNDLLDSGARNELYGYKKWNPGHLSKAELKNAGTNGAGNCTFCSSR